MKPWIKIQGMGIFWDYFKKELGFPLIQRSGLLAGLAQGGAEALDELWEKVKWLRRQFNPLSCEREFLERYAGARGITRHRVENDEVFYRRVVLAYAWQMLGGYIQGLPKIYTACGYVDVKIIELNDEQWAEFDLELRALIKATDEQWEYLIWLANEYKRASARLRTVRMIGRAEGKLRVALAPQSAVALEIWPPYQGQVSGRGLLAVAMMPQTIQTIEVRPPKREPVADRPLYAALALDVLSLAITVYPPQNSHSFTLSSDASLYAGAALAPPSLTITIPPLED